MRSEEAKLNREHHGLIVEAATAVVAVFPPVVLFSFTAFRFLAQFFNVSCSFGF